MTTVAMAATAAPSSAATKNSVSADRTRRKNLTESRMGTGRGRRTVARRVKSLWLRPPAVLTP